MVPAHPKSFLERGMLDYYCRVCSRRGKNAWQEYLAHRDCRAFARPADSRDSLRYRLPVPWRSVEDQFSFVWFADGGGGIDRTTLAQNNTVAAQFSLVRFAHPGDQGRM